MQPICGLYPAYFKFYIYIPFSLFILATLQNTEEEDELANIKINYGIITGQINNNNFFKDQ